MHINPSNKDLWKDDLQWAFELWQKGQDSVKDLKSKIESESSVVIEEISGDEETENVSKTPGTGRRISHRNMFTCTGTSKLKTMDSESQTNPKSAQLPRNYVHMRDT